MNHLAKLCILYLLLTACSTQQSSTIKRTDGQVISVADLQGHVKDIAVDELGYVYILTDQNQLHRCNDTLKILFTYSNNRLGNIHSIDVSNPQKLLVYYNRYGVVASLDNTLTESFILDLHEFGYEDVQAIGLSSDNQIWLYDPLEFKLKKIDRLGNLLFESNSMIHENLEQIKPKSLREAVAKVYLFDNDMLYLFDDYGKYLRKTSLNELRHFQLDNEGKIIWSDGKNIMVTSHERLTETDVMDTELDMLDMHRFIIQADQIVLLDKDGHLHIVSLRN